MERNLMVAGFGGQGVMTLGKFLAEATCDSTDKNVTFFPSYGSERMNEEDGMFTDRGYIAYKGYISMEEVMNGSQSSHMVMGGLSR